MAGTKHTFLGKAIFCVLQFFTLSVLAQSPPLINYQGVARLSNGTPISNKTISIKFDLRQGGSQGSIVASETQTLQTNDLGLFVTQIGKNTNLSVINWQGGSVFLQVGLDTAAGTSFTDLGTYQMVSAPYALHAGSVPSSYTNNVLTIGSSTYVLSPTVAVTPNTSLTVSGLGTITSTGTNTFDINIPAPTFTNAGPATITGAYPNFTINSTTGTTYTNGAGISITSGSVINNTSPNITPSVALTTTVAAGASVSSSGSSFSLNIPPPTFTNAGPATITGAYPNFTINSSAGTTYTSGTGISITSGSVISNILPDITPTVAVTTTAAAGASVASAGSSFSINVPPPTFTNVGPATITGAYPNFTINSPTGITYTSGTGISITSGSIINNMSPDITPTVALTTTAAAGASVSSAGSSFSLNVPPPVFTHTGQVIITGTYPNFAVATPTTPPAITPSIDVTTNAAAGASVSSAGSSFSINIPPPAFNNTGQTLITGTYPNFSVATPTIANTSIALSATAAAGPSISTIGTNSFNINIPPQINTWDLTGNSGTSTLTNFVGTIDNAALNFRVNNQESGVIDHISNNAYFGYQSGQSNSTGSLNVGFGHEALKALTISNRNSAFGYQALFSNTTGNSNTGIGASVLRSNTAGIDNTGLGKDALYYNTTGSSNVALGTAALLNHLNGDHNVAVGRDALNGNVSGANNVALGNYAGYANTTGSGNVFIGSSAGYNETGSNKFVLANTSTSVSPLLYGDFTANYLGIGTSNANAPLQFSNAITGRKIVLWEAANNDHQVYGFGLSSDILRYQVDASTASHVFYSGINSTTSQELMRITGTGNVGIGSNSPTYKLDILGTSGPRLRVYSQDGFYAGMVAKNSTHEFFVGVQGTWETASGITSGFHICDNTAGVRRLVIDYDGDVGINTSSPTATLHVNGTTRLVDGTQGDGKVLSSDANGNASWVNSAINTGFSAYATTSQGITTGSWIQVNFGGEDFDDGADFASNQYVCPTAGVYQFDATVAWSPFTISNTWSHIAIYKNGLLAKVRMETATTGYFSNNISAAVKCAAGDVITIRVYQQSTATENIYGSYGYTYFTGYRIY